MTQQEPVFSARHWAAKSEKSALNAETSASSAQICVQECEEIVVLLGHPAMNDLSNVTSVAQQSAAASKADLNTKAQSNLSNVSEISTVSVVAKKDLSNCPATYDYVIETYQNGTSWYRKYKSGWVEQGGLVTTLGSVTTTFLVPFADTDYTILRTQVGAAGNAGNVNIAWVSLITSVWNKTETSFTLDSQINYGFSGAHWYACGQGA